MKVKQDTVGHKLVTEDKNYHAEDLLRIRKQAQLVWHYMQHCQR